MAARLQAFYWLRLPGNRLLGLEISLSKTLFDQEATAAFTIIPMVQSAVVKDFATIVDTGKGCIKLNQRVTFSYQLVETPGRRDHVLCLSDHSRPEIFPHALQILVYIE